MDHSGRCGPGLWLPDDGRVVIRVVGREKMITGEHRQEQLSRACGYAVAAHAGLICEPATDDYGVDESVRASCALPARRLQELDQ
jgi:hypothetical protein